MKNTVVFDIIGTCFSLDKPRAKLVEFGAPTYALDLWFAQTLRDAFALSHAGGYKPLKQVLEAELPRTMQMLGVDLATTQLASIIESFAELDLQPEALEAFKILNDAGWRLVALTNGSENSTRQLLERANAIDYFDRIFSCDAVEKTKPHLDVYNLVKPNTAIATWMVATHAWDIAGAARAGLKTAFINQQEKGYLAIYPQPEVIALDLVTAASKIVEIA